MKSNKDIEQIIIKSPGRINLIGEHIDYNGGNVLPGSIKHKLTLKTENAQFLPTHHYFCIHLNHYFYHQVCFSIVS